MSGLPARQLSCRCVGGGGCGSDSCSIGYGSHGCRKVARVGSVVLMMVVVIRGVVVIGVVVTVAVARLWL